MPSIPAALVGFREYSTSDTYIGFRDANRGQMAVMDESRASASGGKVTLLKEIIK